MRVEKNPMQEFGRNTKVEFTEGEKEGPSEVRLQTTNHEEAT